MPFPLVQFDHVAQQVDQTIIDVIMSLCHGHGGWCVPVVKVREKRMEAKNNRSQGDSYGRKDSNARRRFDILKLRNFQQTSKSASLYQAAEPRDAKLVLYYDAACLEGVSGRELRNLIKALVGVNRYIKVFDQSIV